MEEFVHGSWFKDAHSHLCHNPDDFLCPLIFYIDKTGTDNKNKLGVEEVLFTFGIFKQSVQNQPRAWCPLFLVKKPKKSKAEAAISNQGKKKGSNCRDYHGELDIILRSLVKVQRGPGVQRPLWNGDKSESGIMANFKFPVGLIIGDIEGHDMHCGRYASHTLGVQAAMRDCDVSPDDCDNPDAICNLITQDLIQQYVEDGDADSLHDLSHHWVKNAWHNVCFGGSKYGVHGACPPEILHFLEIGWIHTALTGFQKNCTDTCKSQIDAFIKTLVPSLKHQSELRMPPLDFPRV